VRRFLWPAEYYSTATPQPVLPRWAPFGCGGAAVLIIVLVFAGGAFLQSGGFVQFMDFVFGMTLAEMRGMYDADLTAAQKQELESEIETLRKHVREEKIAVQRLDPVLKAMARATRDEKVTSVEARELTDLARRANAAARK
jgi:hypothetical protein